MVDHLQEFLLEMGRGFCFVARQRHVTFDNEHYWIDLLLYNRRLQCLVALDLILGRFRHEYAGAMNFYLNYLKGEEMEAGENPPLGILLCSEKNETHVEYALGGMSNRAAMYEPRHRASVGDARPPSLSGVSAQLRFQPFGQFL